MELHPKLVRTLFFYCLLLSLFALALPAASDDHRMGAYPVMPAYDGEQQLLLPEDYQQWVFVGSSLGLSYSEGSGGTEMFHHTLMEPTAYRHFRRTGEFREGTMLALLLHVQGEGVLPQRRGRFAADLLTVEMAVKDSTTFEEGWAYFGFGDQNGLRSRAAAFDGSSCNNCHTEHAAYDNVFLQFYPLLTAAAPAGSPARGAMTSPAKPEAETEQASEKAEGTLVLKGLDPVHLVDGREELGKPEIVITHGAYRYQFVSEPSRARFAAEPDRYSVQNETCPVVPGAPVSPDLFTVHERKIYLFATPNCVQAFEGEPGNFISE